MPEALNLAGYIHSPDHSTKGTRSLFDELSVLVSTRFQVLFHSPPGVLFTFPSRYSSLSVTGLYLGLEGGPPVFPPGFTCPVVLWIQPAALRFAYGILTLSDRLSHVVLLTRCLHYAVQNPKGISTLGLASSDFARHYFRNLV